VVDPKTVGALVGIIGTGGGTVAGGFRFVFWMVDRWKKRKATITQGKPIPSETLRIAAKPESNCWWHMGKRGEDPTISEFIRQRLKAEKLLSLAPFA
jgi:hypothetical protein